MIINTIQCVDDTQDPAEDEQQLRRVKDWISCYHLDNIELADVLSSFPDISVVKTSSLSGVKYQCWHTLFILNLTISKFCNIMSCICNFMGGGFERG